MIAYAAGGAHVTAAQSMIAKLEAAIIFPLITLMMSVAFLYFVWGVYQYILNAEDEGARSTGKQHMMFGIIGFLIIISAYGILKIAAGTFGVSVPN